MIKDLLENIKIFFTDPRWQKVRGVFWFCLITVVIHVAWRFWVVNLHSFPLQSWLKTTSDFFIGVLYDQTTWVVTNILQIRITGIKNEILCDNGAGLILNESCSGIKQILQFAILMLVFPGPWKHKAWFIPLGMIVVHFTNVLRLVLLTVVAQNWPTQVKYAHDNWLRIMFYVIFCLWLLWVEKIGVKKQEPVKDE